MQRTLVLVCLMTLLPLGTAYANTFIFMNNYPAATDQSEHFVSSTPSANQVLDTAPDAVVITFSSPIRPDKSSIRVYDLFGTQLGDGAVTVNGAAMSATLPPLSSGKYAVKWKARCMCDDGNELGDEFHFTVR